MTGEITGFSRIILYPSYMLYRAGVALKNLSFDLKLDKPVKFPAHVISVGGISFGGAGKTPMTIHLAETFAALEPKIGRTAVISRGYLRKSKGLVVVSAGKGQVLVSPEEAGDELYVLAKRAPTVTVIADETRVSAAKMAVENYECKNIILDDCFQHRHIARNLDIVMTEPEAVLNPHKYYMRESPHAIKRANIVVLLDTPPAERPLVEEHLRRYTKAPVLWGWRIPKRFMAVSGTGSVSDEELKYRKTASFCALANPGMFTLTLNNLGIHPKEMLAFPDHCEYDEKDIEKIRKHREITGADILLTTEKDAVKLTGKLDDMNVYYLTIGLEIEGDFLRKVLDI